MMAWLQDHGEGIYSGSSNFGRTMGGSIGPAIRTVPSAPLGTQALDRAQLGGQEPEERNIRGIRQRLSKMELFP